MGERIKLGARVKDKVSGFTGIVTARCEYLSEAPRVLVEAQATESGARAAESWYPETRVEIAEAL